MSLINVRHDHYHHCKNDDNEIKGLLLEIIALLKKPDDQGKVDKIAGTLDENTDKLKEAVTDNTPKDVS